MSHFLAERLQPGEVIGEDLTEIQENSRQRRTDGFIQSQFDDVALSLEAFPAAEESRPAIDDINRGVPRQDRRCAARGEKLTQFAHRGVDLPTVGADQIERRRFAPPLRA